MITDGFMYVALLLFIAGVLVTLEKTSKGGLAKFFKYVPAVVLLYAVTMICCTLNVWDLAGTKPAYSALKNSVTYAMVFAMLLRCDIRKVLKLGPRMILGFLSASLTLMIGFVLAFVLTKGLIGDDSWMGLSALCGSWIGGSGNMVAVQAALDIQDSQMGYALVIDSIEYSLWVMFLLWVINFAPKFNKWTKADTTILDEVSQKLDADAKANTKVMNFQTTILILGTSLLVSSFVQIIGGKLNGLLPFFDKATWTVLTATALGLIGGMSPLGKVAGTADVANLLLYAVVGLLGSRANLAELGDAPAWMLTGLIILVVHSVLMLVICKFTKMDMFTAGVASLANIGGTASAPVLAASYSGSLTSVGVLMALLGYIVGTPLALVTAKIMRMFI